MLAIFVEVFCDKVGIVGSMMGCGGKASGFNDGVCQGECIGVMMGCGGKKNPHGRYGNAHGET